VADDGVVVLIRSAEVRLPDGTVAASVDMVDIGGGEQVVTVDGQPEVRVHPSRRVFHVRLVSPDRMLPDQLREVDDYQAAVALGRAYAARLVEHRGQVEALAGSLQV
jgi:hypothetical protein